MMQHQLGSGLDMKALEAAAEAVLPQLGTMPDCALILGSGWSGAVDAMEVSAKIPYDQIPCLGRTGVVGHKGRLLAGRLGNRQVLVFQGRRHWYEGIGWTPIALPVYLARRAGASSLLLTNAAGGIAPAMHPGDLMVLEDHINMLGSCPLVGPHHAFWGARFPDQSTVYPSALSQLLYDAGISAGGNLHRGVYLAASGPVYETPAEVRAFARLGAHAVGMSTVPEAILANACSLRVAAVSCITNMAAGMGSNALAHYEVIAETRKAADVLAGTVVGFLETLPESVGTHSFDE